MACCAFAAFIFGQFVLAWRALVEMLTGKAIVPRDLAVAWSPGVTSPRPARAPNSFKPAFAALSLALLAEAALVLAMGFGVGEAKAALNEWADSPICRALLPTSLEISAGPQAPPPSRRL